MTDRSPKLATLKDVAALAGVSPSTVSNVVRGSDVVATRTRRGVLAAIDQLGYRPNALARQLVRGRATTIGIIVRDLHNPFTAEMASFAEREIARFGFAAMFCATEGDPYREGQAVTLMLENRVSGLIFLSYPTNPTDLGRRVNGQVPTMFIAADEPWSDSVTVDELRGGELVARHLIGLGHRRLAFVGPTIFDRADARRLEGFLRVAREANLDPGVINWDPPAPELVVRGSRTSWARLLMAPSRPSAIFCVNDFTSIDLLEVADELGIGVPDSLSIVGFDDVDMARLRRINLTTVQQPREELVRLGVERLLGRVDGRVSGDPRVTLTGVNLQLRGTTAAPAPDRPRRSH